MFDSISSGFAKIATNSFTSDWVWLAQAKEKAAETLIPGVSDGVVGFVALLAIIFGSYFIGQAISKSLRLAEYGGNISLILGCILTALLLLAANQFTPKFGIDLRGGINMIGSLNTDALEDAEDGNSNLTTAETIIPNLLRRVDPSGTLEIMIRPLGTDKIEVTIPTNSKAEADEIWTRLVRTGKLQFLIVNERNFSKHSEARQLAENMASRGNLSKRVGSITREIDGQERSLPLAKWFTLAKEDKKDSSTASFKLIPDPGMLLRDSRSGRLVDISQIPFNAADAQIAQRQFTKWWEANQPGSPQVLMMEPDSEDMRVTGEDLNPRDLRIVPDELGRDSMQFGLKPDGARKMYNFTWEHQPDKGSGKYKMAIVLDDLVHNWPQLNSAIQSRGVIEGNFSRNEINELRINLQSGNIAVALNDNPISSQFIESDLGQELKEKGLFAIGISFLIVLVFMIFYYRFAGVVAALALLLNLLFILALIMAIQQPLTLTGLAGLVLTVGMSVDANVLIFERIREELDKGAALRMAIRNGFDKATTTIVDANVTTLITALVLYVIGTEQIKGFSVTLILGILMSMFTAIYCSRTVFDIWERKRWITRLSMIRMFGKTEINFINKRIVAGLLSVALIGVGIAAMFGLQDKILHHDLRGGSTVRVVFNEPPSEDPDQGRQIVKDALDAENIILNDEKIEFSVSKLQSEEFKDCVFKIDSNLPIFDGEGEPPYEELAPLISRVFEGKLELLSVKVSEPQVLNVSAEPAVSDTGWNWVNETTMVSAMTWSNPAVLLVANPQEDETDASSKVEAEATPAETPDDQNQETVEETVSTEEAPAETQDDNSFEPANETEADSDAGVLPEISTDLEFKFSISGKELTTLIVAAAQKADYEMTPEQVVLSSPDGNPSESFNSVSSKNWTVKLNLSNKDEANKILGAWSENYNELPYFPASSGVGGQIATDTQIQAMVAIFASLLGIIAYVWIRFQNVAFGLAAVVALIHDVLIVLGAIAVSHYVAGSLQIIGIEEFKISLPIVAALLTIIGYSLNDTIVVFDRIREVRGKRPELNADIVNTSISQTLSRTILTSLTTFIVVFILYWFGGDAIHGFAFSLVIGVIAGTYSSIFVASPVLLWLMNSVGLNPGDPISEAAAETT